MRNDAQFNIVFNMRFLVLALGTYLQISAVSFSQSFFAESFATTNTSSLLSIPADYSISSGIITPTGGRNEYIKTFETGYNVIDFKMELTIHLDNLSGAQGIAWVGIGSGLPDVNWFNQPKYGCYAALQPATQGGGGFTIDSVPLPSDGPQVWQNRWVTTQTLGNTLRLNLLKVGDNLTFSLDPNFSGQFNPVYSDSVALSSYAPFLNSTNSSLFFGSGSSTGFSDFSVSAVPEPSALSLLAVGLGVVLRQRRRTV